MGDPVVRDSKPVEFGVKDDREYHQSGIVGPGQSRGADHVSSGAGTEGFLRAVGRLSDTVSGSLNKLADLHYQNRYLEGQAKAYLAKSEDEIQGNPLTRDWEVAGYRDTMGKLALADQKASFQEDITRIRTMSKPEFEAYMAARRKDMLPALNSMSKEARASMAGQLLLQDRADTTTWGAEHTKYIIEQKSAAVATLWNTALQTMHTVQTQYSLGELDKTSLDRQVEASVGNLVGAVWLDDSLPGDVKRKLTYQAMSQALANDSTELYDYMASAVMNDQRGQQSTLMSRLPQEDQEKLANAYRGAKQRTSDTRNLAFMEQLAKLEAGIADGTTEATYNSLKEFLDPMVVRGAISGERREGIMKQFLTEKRKKDVNTSLVAAAVRGDYNAIVASGATMEQAIKAVDVTLAKTGASPEQRLDTYLRMGLNGIKEGYSKAGAQLGVAMRQLRGPDGNVLSQHMKVFESINDTLLEAERKGDVNARISVLSGMDEKDRLFAERIFQGVNGGGKSFEEAQQRAMKEEEIEAKLTPSQKAALAADTQERYKDALQNLDSKNFFSHLAGTVKAAFGSDEAAYDNVISPYSSFSSQDGYFTSKEHISQKVQNMKEELALEMAGVATAHGEMSTDSVVRLAKANLAARTIQTDYGPIYTPRNLDVQAAFGVSGGNVAMVGKAVSDLVKVQHPDTGSAIVRFDKKGRLMAISLNKDGVSDDLHPQEITPEAIRTRIKEITNGEQRAAEVLYGAGMTKQLPGGKVTFNGDNSAGVDAGWMVRLRNMLAHFEGVSTTPYKDSRGHSVGVGIFEENRHYPESAKKGKPVTQEEIDKSFKGASDDVAVVAAKLMDKYNLPQKPETFMLLGSLAYQSGPGFAGDGVKKRTPSMENQAKVIECINTGDLGTALVCFKKTAAYKQSPPERQATYLALIRQIIPK